MQGASCLVQMLVGVRHCLSGNDAPFCLSGPSLTFNLSFHLCGANHGYFKVKVAVGVILFGIFAILGGFECTLDVLQQHLHIRA